MTSLLFEAVAVYGIGGLIVLAWYLAAVLRDARRPAEPEDRSRGTSQW